MAKPDIQLVIFDIDGTLVDSSELIYQAYEHTFRFHNLNAPDRVRVATTIGRKLEDAYAVLAPDVTTELLTVTHRFGTREALEKAQPDHTIDSIDQLLPLCGVPHGS